jgi:molybdopterin/thiamine biosynthesis adenylyltransferase
MNDEKPIVFSLRDDAERSKLEHLKRDHPELKIISDCSEAVRELALRDDPTALMDPTRISIPDFKDSDGVWVYYPWKNVLVHTLAQSDFQKVRLSRNHNLITSDELEVLAKAKIAIAGLNVGNPGAVCLAQEGVGRSFVFADNDALGLSNLNRFRAGLTDLNVNKAILSARQVYEINPFIDIKVYEQGISHESMDDFLSGADILIEEMDALPLKILARQKAKELKVPVVMVTGNGHDLILDIERYDTDPDLEILSGKLSVNIARDIQAGPKSFEEKLLLARDFMGKEFLCERLNASFSEVGKTLIGIPQIAETTFLRGAVLAHAVRAIVLNTEHARSGRYVFGLTNLFSDRR